MTLFLRLLDSADKANDLRRSVQACGRQFVVNPATFKQIPGSPFAYWVTDTVRALFREKMPLEGQGRSALGGLKTLSDERFVRAWWELRTHDRQGWPNLAKGGAYSPFYADVFLCVNWKSQGEEISWYGYQRRPREGFGATSRGIEAYFRPGLTWPRRTNGLSFRAMPAGCIFADKGPAVFVERDEPANLLALCAVMNSQPFGYLVSVQLARTELAQSYEVGLIQQTPIPALTPADLNTLAMHARRAWSLKRMLDTINETAHAFLLPDALCARLGSFEPDCFEAELAENQGAIDDFAFRAYDIQDTDRAAIEAWMPKIREPRVAEEATSDDGAEAEDRTSVDTSTALHSWAVGVAFSRFDIRLATGERQAPPEPEPFDPLPTRSPGMIPEPDEARFPAQPLLVDDPGHPLDLATRAGNVLERVGFPPESPETLRRWLARDFFPLHIKMYSKSRRKAPIYWQLATPSASYSVWLYIHAFSRDALYQVQEIAELKLLHEERKLQSQRADLGSNPTAAERKELSARESFVEELRAFLDEVKRVAPLWNPNLDDGVIINFAPLWRLVSHHKSWQKELKASWDSLCAGGYDWAHLAMHLWPERVVPKCATDRSLAIAHDLEDVFWMEGEDGKWKPRPKPTRPVDELVRERTSAAVKAALKSLLEAPVASAGNGRGRPRRGRRTAGTPT